MGYVGRSFVAFGLISLMIGCGPGTPEPLGDVASGDDFSSGTPGASPSITFGIELTQTSQNPTPTGLPTRFSVASAELRPGEAVSGVWTAENGDPDREPRQGAAEFRLGSGGSELLIVLFEEGGSPSGTEVLSLAGVISNETATGTFSDRLYFPRAGVFAATRR